MAWPSIYGSRVAYNCSYTYHDGSEQKNATVGHVFDGVSEESKMIVTGSLAIKYQIWLEQRYVSWIEEHCRACYGDIMAYDLQENKPIPVATEDYMEDDIDTDGSRIAYMIRPGYPNSDIMLYDLDTGERTQITNDEHMQFFTSIQGDFITWTDLRNGRQIGGDFPGVYENSDIYAYRISTGETFQITSDPSNQEFSKSYGDLVVWVDLRHGWQDATGRVYESELYLHDLVTGREIRVTNMPGVEKAPQLYGTMLIWEHNINGGDRFKDDIYIMDVSRLIGRER